MSAAESLFLDTNVLVYAWDRSEPVKGPFAKSLLQQILQTGRPCISVQVLSEFFWTATRKLPFPLTFDEATAEAKRLLALTRVEPLTPDLFTDALDAVGRHGMPLWDAQIFVVAKSNHAAVVLSEDFQHRRVIEGVTFLNPFAADFDIAEVLPPP